jgi:hypothetical protein
VDADGRPFESDAVADNISSSGVYVRLRHRVESGTRLFILVRLPGGATSTDSGPLLAAYADVVRAEPKTEDTLGLALLLKRRKLS